MFRFHVPMCNYYYVQREAGTYHIFIYVEHENVPVSRQIKICRVDAVDIRGNDACLCFFFNILKEGININVLDDTCWKAHILSPIFFVIDFLNGSIPTRNEIPCLWRSWL